MTADMAFYAVKTRPIASEPRYVRWRWELRLVFSQRPLARSFFDFSTEEAAMEAAERFKDHTDLAGAPIVACEPERRAA